MLVKFVFLLIMSSAMLAYDVPKCKRSGRLDQLAYGALMLPILYLGFLYVTEKSWPNLDDLVNFIFVGPAKRMVESFQP